MVPTTAESDIYLTDIVGNDIGENVFDDTGRVNIQYSPENSDQAETSSTYFKGGQIYSPMWRKISSQTAMKDLSSLSKFPECLKHYIWPLREGFAPGNGVPHQTLRTQTHAMFNRITEAFKRFQDNLNQFGSLPVRIELFTKYDPSRDYKVTEKLDDLPNFLSLVKKYNVDRVKDKLREKSEKLYAPIKALMKYDLDRHEHDARPPIFFAFGNREVLASVVICAEQLNAVTGICWAGPYSKREMANNIQIREKLGGLIVRPMNLEDCSEAVRELTKLEKTVSMTIMLQPQPDSFRQGRLDFKGRLVPAWMYRQAENLKKMCHYPILYVASAARIEKCLQQLSTDPHWDFDTGEHPKTGWCDWSVIKYNQLAGIKVDIMENLLEYLAKEMIQVYYQLSIWEMNRKQKKQEKKITSLTPEQAAIKQFSEKTFPVTLDEYEEWDKARQDNDSTKDFNFKFLKLKTQSDITDEGNYLDAFIVRDWHILFGKMFGSANDVDTSHVKSPAWKIARDVESVINNLRKHAAALSAKDNEEATANVKLLQCTSHFKKLIAKKLFDYTRRTSNSANEADSLLDYSEVDEEQTITPLILNVWKNRYRSEFGQLLPVQISRSQLRMSTYEEQMRDQSLSNTVVMETDTTNLIAIQLNNMEKDDTCMEESESDDETATRYDKTIRDDLPFATKHDVSIL